MSREGLQRRLKVRRKDAMSLLSTRKDRDGKHLFVVVDPSLSLENVDISRTGAVSCRRTSLNTSLNASSVTILLVSVSFSRSSSISPPHAARHLRNASYAAFTAFGTTSSSSSCLSTEHSSVFKYAHNDCERVIFECEELFLVHKPNERRIASIATSRYNGSKRASFSSRRQLFVFFVR